MCPFQVKRKCASCLQDPMASPKTVIFVVFILVIFLIVFLALAISKIDVFRNCSEKIKLLILPSTYDLKYIARNQVDNLIQEGVIQSVSKKDPRPEFVVHSDGGVTCFVNQILTDEEYSRRKQRTVKSFTTPRALVSINVTTKFDKRAKKKVCSKIMVKPSNGMVSTFILLRRGFS